MNLLNAAATPERQQEVSALIETLHVTGQRLEDLTSGQVDTVTDRRGRTVMLRRAQDFMRHNEAAKQEAILNALPAHIALLDAQGRIVSVNQAWCQFADANGLRAPACGVGLNYLTVCDAAEGGEAAQAQQVAAGIRAVLAGSVPSVSLEYPCHAPTAQRWFLMAVTPLAVQSPHGVVVMHLDITERKLAERAVIRLNRVYAVLSGINGLIVRVDDRDELFREACRIAVDAGGFRMALIAIVDRGTQLLTPIASAGKDEKLMNAIRGILASAVDAPKTMSARAIREKRAVVANDAQHDPQVLFSSKYAESGVFSMAVLPLMVAHEAVGVLALYAGETGFFQDEELKLLTELAGDIGFAMDHLDKQERLNYLAYYDVLTGLANRTLFLERVSQFLRSAVIGGHQLALLVIDLERFRNINDSLGRSVGDELLRQVAQWLTQHAVGDVNLLARVGPDHFAVVMPVVSADGNLARLIEKRVEQFLKHSFRLDGAAFRIALKLGVAVFPQAGADADTLFKHAEVALKKAKSNGDRYLFYTQTMTHAGADKLILENQLRQALDNDEFELYYQPKVNLASGKMTSAEALIRWNDPHSGLVPPGLFIPILEETGLIHEVGRWALRQAVSDFLSWRAEGLPVVRIAVNVSPLQLRDRGFIAEVWDAISRDAAAAAGLELEITESLIMENVEHSIATLHALRNMGLSIAIDDFGTGFSSLSYLSRFPVDSLKIDRSFVIEMTESTQGLALVSTIINLAHALKLKVVAEGVETEAQAHLLRGLDCDEMQGYLFSRPVPGELFKTRFLLPSPDARQS
ncbi:EAL domain-containing protein [Rhodoferax sp.]|uniref:sensor domain-containing protein n=1 Tax=Rhodoferax sp. TaxID=50421 RepID=UPI0025EBE94A|nr:EAL domain-containing protein [Rhodoferax sp.]MCM2339897.1 EAL domain-containing protein [Rhodoferax sp.]